MNCGLLLITAVANYGHNIKHNGLLLKSITGKIFNIISMGL